MKLTVVWHKPIWSSEPSPTGFACRGCLGHPGFGGLPRELEALSRLFDSTRLVAPYSSSGDPTGESPISGKNISVAALTWLPRFTWLTWTVLPFWLARNGFKLAREIWAADAVFALIPSPIGVLGLIFAFAFRKPLLTRQLNKWSEQRLLWRLERSFLERIAGGRNVVFATGSSDGPPSIRNSAIRWLFMTTLSEREMADDAVPVGPKPAGNRIIVVGREVELERMRIVLRALSLLGRDFPAVAVDVVGDLGAPSILESAARDSGVLDRVKFHGSPGRERILELLREADLMCCLPAAETESFRQALHEALACGLPVVTARTEIAPLLMRKGCAVVLERETPEALAAALAAGLSDAARRQSMSARALRTAREYSLERWRETVRSALEQAWGPLQLESREAIDYGGRSTASSGLVK
jgi:glycosyltransferase involved in cell wall biosynthesis